MIIHLGQNGRKAGTFPKPSSRPRTRSRPGKGWVRGAHLVDGVPHVQFALLLVLIFLVLHVDIYIASGAQLLVLRGKSTDHLSPQGPGLACLSQQVSICHATPWRLRTVCPDSLAPLSLRQLCARCHQLKRAFLSYLV